MSKAAEKAFLAKQLREHEAFQDFVKEVLEDQTKVFLNAHSTPEAREQAHLMVRAIEAIKGKLNAAEAGLKLEEHNKEKGQHRGND